MKLWNPLMESIKSMESIISMLDWSTEHPALVAQILLASLMLALAYAVGVFLAITRMSPDYFARSDPAAASWRYRHPSLRLLFRGLKNFFGAILVILGVAMLLLPGQGILTILIGISLLDFPGKRRVEISIISRPTIQQWINRIREKAGRAPLVLPRS